MEISENSKFIIIYKHREAFAGSQACAVVLWGVVGELASSSRCGWRARISGMGPGVAWRSIELVLVLSETLRRKRPGQSHILRQNLSNGQACMPEVGCYVELGNHGLDQSRMIYNSYTMVTMDLSWKTTPSSSGYHPRNRIIFHDKSLVTMVS